jgi:hypothetical protein
LEREVASRARAFGLPAEKGAFGRKQGEGAAFDVSVADVKIECRNRAGMTLPEAIRQFRNLSKGYSALAFKFPWGRRSLILVCTLGGGRGLSRWRPPPCEFALEYDRDLFVLDLDGYLRIFGGVPPEEVK